MFLESLRCQKMTAKSGQYLVLSASCSSVEIIPPRINQVTEIDFQVEIKSSYRLKNSWVFWNQYFN